MHKAFEVKLLRKTFKRSCKKATVRTCQLSYWRKLAWTLGRKNTFGKVKAIWRKVTIKETSCHDFAKTLLKTRHQEKESRTSEGHSQALSTRLLSMEAENNLETDWSWRKRAKNYLAGRNEFYSSVFENSWVVATLHQSVHRPNKSLYGIQVSDSKCFEGKRRWKHTHIGQSNQCIWFWTLPRQSQSWKRQKAVRYFYG